MLNVFTPILNNLMHSCWIKISNKYIQTLLDLKPLNGSVLELNNA